MTESAKEPRPTLKPKDWTERPPLVLAGGSIDFARSRFARADGVVVPLSSREAEVLAYLSDRPNEVVTRESLLVDVFEYSAVTSSRALDTCVARLRKKLERDPEAPEMLFTAHGSGYRMRVGEVPPTSAEPAGRVLFELACGELDLGAGHVSRAGERLPLTEQERQILSVLWRQRGRAMEARELARKASLASPGAVKNAIFRLRKKLEVDPSNPTHLLSVSGFAYRFECQERQLDVAVHLSALLSLTDYLGLVLSMPDCVIYTCRGEVLEQCVAFGPKRDGRGVRAPLRQTPEQGLVGMAAATRQPVVCADVATEPRYLPDLVPASSELAVPVLMQRRLVGVIDLEHPLKGAFDHTHVSTLLSLAAIAAPAFAALETSS